MMDLLPTFARLAGTRPPADGIIDGRDILPLWERRGESPTPHKDFDYYFMGQLQAVGSGPWKLHLPPKAKRHGWHQPTFEEPGRLYDLDADPAGSRDILPDHPDVVACLLALAARAREDLGDGDVLGKSQRPAGWVEKDRPLRKARS